MNTFVKTTAIAAALTLGTAAAAESNFGLQTVVDNNNAITVDLVRTDAAGMLAIYDYSGGKFGEVLGTAPLTAGVNSTVKITLDNNASEELAAVIYEGDVTEPTMASGWMELSVSDDSDS